MKRARCLALALLTLTATASSARAQAFDKLPEGALAYASARPSVVIGVLQKLGVEQLPAIQRFRKQLGGIDPFNPILLAAPGIDIDAPLVAALFESVPGVGTHSRVVAQLRDKATFATFVMGVIASGQLPLTAAPSVKDAAAMGNLSPNASFVLRIIGNEALLDEVEVAEGKKAPTAAEIARRFPATPARKVVVAKGARRLLSSDVAAALYVDARKLDPLLARSEADDVKNALAGAHAEHTVNARAREKACAVWLHAPALFDDVALAVDARPEGLTVTWAWGTQNGPPLGGLKLAAVDDTIVDAQALAQSGAGMFALYAANLAPFAALKRSGIFATVDAFNDAVSGCETDAGILLFLRSWPLAIGAVAAATPAAGTPLSTYKQQLSALRNIVIGLRSVDESGMHGAAALSFDAGVSATFAPLLAMFGGAGVPTQIGARSPTIYAMKLPDAGKRQFEIGTETIGGHFGLTVADSDAALRWAYQAADGAVKRAHPPLARLSADAALLSRIGQQLGVASDEQALLDMLSRLRRLDGTLAAEGDTLRLTLHAPLKP